MNVYDKLEEAGHDLTLVAPMMAGVSTYYCENCGALIQLSSSAIHGTNEVRLFHVFTESDSKEDCCIRVVPMISLKSKLDALAAADYERLKDV